MILFTPELLFVHNPKTAGTSLLAALEAGLPGPVRTAGVRELGTWHPHLDLALGYACGVLGRRPQDFRHVVASIRDPLEREVSMYVYYREHLAKDPESPANLNDPAQTRAVEKAAELDFPRWVEWLCAEHGGSDIWRSRLFYEHGDGRRPERLRLLRAERLDEDLRGLFEAMGLPAPPLPRLNRMERAPAAAWYDEATAARVLASYAWMRDYGYGGPAG